MNYEISAILMAAGFSRRMGEDKLFMSFQGKTLLAWALDLLDKLPVSEKIIVTTSKRLEKVSLPSDIQAVTNHNAQIGQSESLRLGLSAASGQWYLFLNADQPKLALSNIMPLIELTKTNVGKIIYPVYKQKPCSPVIFHSIFRENLLKVTGDRGARLLKSKYPDACVEVEIDAPYDFMDIDTKEDLDCLSAFERSDQLWQNLP